MPVSKHFNPTTSCFHKLLQRYANKITGIEPADSGASLSYHWGSRHLAMTSVTTEVSRFRRGMTGLGVTRGECEKSIPSVKIFRGWPKSRYSAFEGYVKLQIFFEKSLQHKLTSEALFPRFHAPRVWRVILPLLKDPKNRVGQILKHTDPTDVDCWKGDSRKSKARPSCLGRCTLVNWVKYRKKCNLLWRAATRKKCSLLRRVGKLNAHT